MGSLTTANFAIIDANQHLWTWGTNTHGEIGRANTDINPHKVSDEKWKCVSYSNSAALAIKEDGSLWGWGYNLHNRLGLGGLSTASLPTLVTGAASITKFKKVVCGYYNSYAIDEEGRLWGTGVAGKMLYNLNEKPASAEFIIIDKENRYIDISITLYDYATGNATPSSAISDKGQLIGWGYQNGTGSDKSSFGNGVLGNKAITVIDTGDVRFKKVSKGMFCSLAIDTENNLWITGGQPYGELGTGSTVTEFQGYTKTDISNVLDISCGRGHSMIIKEDGTLWGAGFNTSGQLGDGTITTRITFTQIGTDLWDKVSCGQNFTLGLKQDGTAWAWGYNAQAQLGVGDTINKSIPTPLYGLTDNIVTLEDIPLIQKYITNDKGVFELKSNPIPKLNGFNVRGTFPIGTHILIQVSEDHANWMTYDETTSSWIPVNDLNSGLTIKEFESLSGDKVKHLDNKEIYLKVIMWTEDETVSPLFKSIDARVLMSTESPEVSAASLSYSLSSQDEPEFFLSEDGGTSWRIIPMNEAVELHLSGRKDIQIKIVLKDGQELDALAYSWK